MEPTSSSLEFPLVEVEPGKTPDNEDDETEEGFSRISLNKMDKFVGPQVQDDGNAESENVDLRPFCEGDGSGVEIETE